MPLENSRIRHSHIEKTRRIHLLPFKSTQQRLTHVANTPETPNGKHISHPFKAVIILHCTETSKYL